MAFLPGLRVGLTLDTATFVSETRRVGAAVDRMGGNVARQNALAEQSFGKLNSAVGIAKNALIGFGAAIGITGLVSLGRQIVSTSDEFQKLSARVRISIGETENFAEVQQKLFQVAQETRQSLSTTTEVFARLANAMRETGASSSAVLDITETLGKAIAISGASSSEASAALLQLSQAMGAGRLQGDELRSIMENMPILARAIAKEMGVTIGELKDLGKEGEITAEIITKAIRNMAPQIEKDFARVPITVAEAMTQVRNSITQLVGDTERSTEATRNLAKALSTLGATIGSAEFRAGFQEFVAEGIQRFVGSIREAQKIAATVEAFADHFVRFKNQSLAAIKALVDGIGKWLGSPFKAAFDSVTGTLDATRAKFQEWYQAIVGGSIVPDTVREIQGWMERLKGPAMVDQATEAVDRTIAEFARLQAINDEEMRRRVGQANATGAGGGSPTGVNVTQQTDEMVRAFEHAQDSIQGTFADTFTTIFEGGVTSAQDFATELKGIFTRLAGEIAALMIIRPALAGGALSGATGAAGAAAPGLAQQLGLGTLSGGTGGFLGARSGASLGGLILAGGLGAAGGSTIGGLFGGQGGIGGGIGGGLGAVAGTALFGPIGGVVGGLGGSLLGGALGGLFGGGDDKNRVRIGRGLGGLGGSSAAARFVEEVDKGIVAALTESQRKMVDRLIEPVTVEYEKQLDEASKRAIATARFGPAAQALGFRVAGITGGGALPAEEQQKRFLEAIQTQEQISDLTKGFGDFTATARALAEQFADLRDRAKEYGISLEGVSAAQRDAGRDLIKARVAELGGSAANTFASQLEQLNEDFADLRQGARELGLSTDGISAAGKRAVAALREQRNARLDEIQTQTRIIGRSISWREQVELLSQQFHAARIETSRLGGDVEKLREIQKKTVDRLKEQRKEQAELERAQRISAIQSIKDRAQSLTGITPTFRQQIEAVNRQFAELRSQMRALGGGVDGLTSAGKRAIETLKAQQRAQQDALALSVVEPFRELADPLRGFRDELRISMLNPAQQVADAAETFRRMADEAAGGSITALQGIVGAGQRFIEQQGRFGASPAIAAATAEVQSVIEQLLKQIERAQAQAERGLEDAIKRASQREIDTMKEIIAEARNIVAEIRRISR